MSENENSASAIVCENCSAENPQTNKFCTDCGFPIQGSDEEMMEYRVKIARRQQMLKNSRKKVSEAKTVIYVIAGLTFLFGLIMGLSRDDFDTLITSVVICILYLILAAWSNRNPFGAILTAFIIYVTLHILSAIVDPATIVSGIILKVIFIGIFIKGIQSAFQAKNLIRELEAYKARPTGND